MDQNRSWIARALLIPTAAVFLVGCQAYTREIHESGTVVDPCADRLHDISGRLLLYYSLNKRLPHTLDDLETLSGKAEAPPLVCPMSGKPYIYRPEGLPVPGHEGRLVLYDAAPVHSGMRWGIFLGEPRTNGSCTARVILLPEESMPAAQRTGAAETGAPKQH